MLPQYIILLGARSDAKAGAAVAGRFEENDYRTMERIIREEHGFSGCTIIRAKGFFQGQEEDTVQIIVLAENYDKIKLCAQELRARFRQQSVLVISAGVGEFLT
jgi:hypothetical protein